MPGSIVTQWPTSSVSVDSVERRGASCTARPTPWPSPWPKLSPKPAAVIGSRAIASASMPVIPALIPATACQLRVETDVVCPAELVGQRPAGRERPRAVAVVAVDLRAPVDRHERALLDDRLGRVRMRQRTVRARRDDRRERQLVRTVRVQQLVQAPGELELAAADPRLRGQRLEPTVGDPRGLPQLRDLFVVLDRAHRVDDPARRDELRLAGRQPLPLEVRQHVGLELHRALQLLADVDRQRALRHLDGRRPRPTARLPRSGSRCTGSSRRPAARAARRSSCRSRTGRRRSSGS